jgi:mannose-1-phosphate guanylyltransferase
MEPLETIGPLSLLRDQLDEPFLVLNGDVLLNLNQFVSGHRRSISTLDRQVDPPDQDGLWRDRRYGRTRQRFSAKSPSSRTCQHGNLLHGPSIVERIPSGVPFGFDDLMFQMLNEYVPVNVLATL